MYSNLTARRSRCVDGEQAEKRKSNMTLEAPVIVQLNIFCPLLQFTKHTKLGNTYLVTKSNNEAEGLEEIIKHFKINVKRYNVFSRCMVCNCDEFLVASKVQMIKLRQEHAPVPDYLIEFLKKPAEYSRVSFPENKRLWNWQRYNNEVKTKYGAKIDVKLSDGTLKSFQTFYICERCAKVYWDGGHYANSEGKLDLIFNLFPEAENSR